MASWAHKQSVDKGIEEAIGAQFERRLGRPLSERERATVVQRLGALGPGRLSDLALDLTAEALDAWLCDPSAR